MYQLNDRDYVSQAQAKRFLSEKELVLSKRIQLLCDASELYLKACDTVDDQLFKHALAMLANDVLSEAQKLKSLSAASNIDSHTIATDSNVNRASSSIKDQDFQWTIQANRIIAVAHAQRVAGLSEIPKAQPPSLSETVRDMLQMEKQLANMGFRRSKNLQVSTLHQSHAPTSGHMQDSTHMFSALGESFMVLNDDFRRRDIQNDDRSSMLSNPVKNNLLAMRTACPTTHSNVPPASNQTPQSISSVPSLLNEHSLNSIAQFVPYLASLVTQPPPSNVAEMQLNKQSPQTTNDNIEWNEQSLFLPKKATAAKDISMESSQFGAELGSSSAPNNEGVMRLLTTIGTLRDENIRLEQENQLMGAKMESFRKEYTMKFKDLKRYLDDYKDAYPPEKNPFKLSDENGDIEKLKKDLDLANERRTQLEQALSGVLDKYYSAKEDIKRKSELLDKLCALSTYVKAEQQDQNLQSLVHELSMYSRKKQEKERQAESGIQGRKVIVKPPLDKGGAGTSKPPGILRSDSSNSVENTASSNGMSSPNALYSRKQLMQSGQRNKHSATTTLESLQKNAKKI